MKKLITVQIEIPAEADNDECLEDLLDNLKKEFNRKYSKTSLFSAGSKGSYSWHYPNKNATIINIKDNDDK
jgi:hypothetical protein